MLKLLENTVEVVYWLLIFLCPALIGGIAAAWAYFKFDEQLAIPSIILGIGMVCGVLLAERIRRKYGCSNLFDRSKRTGGDETSPW